MNTGAINFTLGLDASDFDHALGRAGQALESFNAGALNFKRGLESAGDDMPRLAENSELLQHSLDLLGGSFPIVNELSHIKLDPVSLAFFALSKTTEVVAHTLAESAARMREFMKEGAGVERIVKGIINARPTESAEWVGRMKAAAESASKGPSALDYLKGYSERSDEAQQGFDKNKADAIQAQIKLEQQKVELRLKQGQISEADAAKQIAALKTQARLQKNLAERTAIKDAIGAKQSELGEVNKLASRNPVGQAFARQQAADAQVADMQKQIEDLPQAIAGNKKLQAEANKNAERHPFERAQWLEQATFASDRIAQLQPQLDAAKSGFAAALKEQTAANQGYQAAQDYQSRATELTRNMADLGARLRVAQDRQQKMTSLESQQIQLETGKASAGVGPHHQPEFTSLEKMGFVMGGANPALDYARRTAAATEKIAGFFSVAGQFSSVQSSFQSVQGSFNAV